MLSRNILSEPGVTQLATGVIVSKTVILAGQRLTLPPASVTAKEAVLVPTELQL